MRDDELYQLFPWLEEKVKQYNSVLFEFTNNTILDELNKAYVEFGIYQQEKIKEIFSKSVDDFYNAYEPKKYVRRHGLYDLLALDTDVNGMVISNDDSYLDMFNEENMHTDRNGGSLFDKVFINGYHGGAESIDSEKSEIWGKHPRTGTPYYRKQGWVKYPGNSKSMWHRYGKWGQQAVKTKSAYAMFYDRYSVAKSGEMFNKFKELSGKYHNIAVNKVYENVGEIKKNIFG